jgi:SAM-dependent methyltransferase
VDRQVHADTRVLDIGCGSSDLLREAFARAQLAFGIDTAAQGLAKNTIVNAKAIADAEHLPFEGSSFDMALLAWVLEHLERPETAFREIHRVLKPHGAVIFLTPNAWNYNSWLIRLVPNALHPGFTSRLYARPGADTFPTRYRLNTIARIESLLTRLGFQREGLILNGDPTYVGLNEPLFKAACFVERILDLQWFRGARAHIIGMYRKTRFS